MVVLICFGVWLGVLFDYVGLGDDCYLCLVLLVGLLVWVVVFVLVLCLVLMDGLVLFWMDVCLVAFVIGLLHCVALFVWVCFGWCCDGLGGLCVW